MDALPPNALVHLPVLVQEAALNWPEYHHIHYLAGQVEQETCPSLRSKKCWSPRAELKTDREYGFGLGQITITSKFNNFLEAKKLGYGLALWSWEDRYNPRYQLRTLVLMNRSAYGRLKFIASPYERNAMMFSAYNGGMGGVLNDRKVCQAIKGCDPNKWFGNVAEHSLKNKTKVQGYGKSFFDINREYVVNVMRVRSTKYIGEV